MAITKNVLIQCHRCGRKILVKPADAERGEISCSHTGCGAVNILTSVFYYDETLVENLTDFGHFTHLSESGQVYPLRFGPNSIGVGRDCSIQLPRLLHHNQCFISRFHCTLIVSFDKWKGQFRYQLQDGMPATDTTPLQLSKNGTKLNNMTLQPHELIDVPDGGLITLGGLDSFQLTHCSIPITLLENYRISLGFDPDLTE